MAAGALLLGGAAVLAASAGGSSTGAFRPTVSGGPVLGIFPLGIVTGDNARLNLDPLVNQYGVVSVTWQVVNTGTVTGQMGGHIIIQERGPSGENAVVEGDWARNSQGVPVPRLRTANLSTQVVASDPSRSVTWVPPATPLPPGASALAFALQVGSLLLEGKTELDIVVIARRLDTLAEVAQVRFPNALQAIRSQGFVPALSGAPTVEVLV